MNVQGYLNFLEHVNINIWSMHIFTTYDTA
jgi:hypothetical protein